MPPKNLIYVWWQGTFKWVFRCNLVKVLRREDTVPKFPGCPMRQYKNEVQVQVIGMVDDVLQLDCAGKYLLDMHWTYSYKPTQKIKYS